MVVLEARIMANYLLDYFGSRKSVSDLNNLDFTILAYLPVLNEDNKALNSCYPVAFSASFRYAYVIFLALFNRFRTRVESAVKARTLHPLYRGSTIST
jgi:hypothetical protein